MMKTEIVTHGATLKLEQRVSAPRIVQSKVNTSGKTIATIDLAEDCLGFIEPSLQEQREGYSAVPVVVCEPVLRAVMPGQNYVPFEERFTAIYGKPPTKEDMNNYDFTQ